MAALSANFTNLETRPRAGRSAYLVGASTTIYAGGFVGLNSSGHLVPWAGGTANVFVGYAHKGCVTAAGETAYCEVNDGGDILKDLTIASSSQASVGDAVYCGSDNIEDLTTVATTAPKVGTISKYSASGSEVHLAVFAAS